MTGMMRRNRYLGLLLITLFLFSFQFSFVQAAHSKCIWTDVKKIVAVGDIHGDYDNFVTILIKTGIISKDLHWIAGSTHFVQTGDVMDRGPHAKKVFDLLIKLEKEAELANGKVHFLIGNHEEMNITGIALGQSNYVTPEQFVSFLPDRYKRKKERQFKESFEDSASDTDDLLRQYWYQLMRNDDKAQRKYIENFNKVYGEWILKHNVAIMINEIVFVHGGISKNFSTWELEDINERARYELSEIQQARLKGLQGLPSSLELKIAFQPNGPFWYRELARQDEEFFKSEVDLIMDNLKARAIVIAHTPKTGMTASAESMSRFDQRVWIIDTGISETYGGILSALIFKNGNFYIWSEPNEKNK
ncbi:MAG: hypothetical protein GF421_10350 [Candidatus Aminicenantes bacterium]|nr:hypothetical protein [Candidatus Aminicenantes bacterium]